MGVEQAIAIAAVLFLISPSLAADCTSDDYGQQVLPCDIKAGTRKLVHYLKTADCDPKNSTFPKPVDIPCACPPGKGIESITSGSTTCKTCAPGSYNAGGEIINDWYRWTLNGTVPPRDSGIITYCDSQRRYVAPCAAWKASVDNLTIDSGDNGQSRCLTSVLYMQKSFVGANSKVSFNYRVEGRACVSSFLGCDGLSFLVDDIQVLDHIGSSFQWKTFTTNLTAGVHSLKWIYRKSCYSFPDEGLLDKAFIRSITLIGSDEPNPACSKCPPGSVSDKTGASNCTECPYFQYQPDSGKTKCETCPLGTYSTNGASKCFPLMNCTKEDIIEAPGDVSKCYSKNGSPVTAVYPQYLNVAGFKRSMLCKPRDALPHLKEVPCTCQPGFELVPSSDKNKLECKKCEKGTYSLGSKCAKCGIGEVGLSGKHYCVWFNGTLPDGFSSGCTGDCGVKSGWIPSGKYIRTGHVIGNLDSYLESPTFDVDSIVAKISFNCSVRCNITEKRSRRPGEHLAAIRDCNLVFQVWSGSSLVDELNCTAPKGAFPYRHGDARTGRTMRHDYPLKTGKYRFRWVFHQTDQSRAMMASFEAKLSAISIVGVKDGEAMSCTKCDPGFQSNDGNTDCQVCPKGTYSSAATSSCTLCPDGTFADQNTSSECLKCGAQTHSLKTRDGCTTNGCVYSPHEGVLYNLTALSRPGGPMFEVLPYQPSSSGRQRRRSPIIYPPRGRLYYLNLCTVTHENTSCVTRDRATGVATSLPVMACRTSWWWSTDVSLGRVIEYQPAKGDVRSGLIVNLLHGGRCRGNLRFHTTVELQCDMKAGVGNPGPVNNYTDVYRSPCGYHFLWKSLYACPQCNEEDVKKVYSECVNGTRNVTYIKSRNCVGDVNVENGYNESCGDGGGNGGDGKGGNVSASRGTKKADVVWKILVGVGVVIIVVLLVVAAVFIYKHRELRYKYYSTLTRDKTMKRLAEEDEDHIIDHDEFADVRA